MIQPNELRIGNIVDHPVEGNLQVVKIKHKSATFFNKDGKFRNYSYDNVCPIELGPRVLAAHSISFDPDHGLELNRFVSLKMKKVDIQDVVIGLYYDGLHTAGLPIHNLHDLQNIYFAFTRKEIIQQQFYKLKKEV